MKQPKYRIKREGVRLLPQVKTGWFFWSDLLVTVGRGRASFTRVGTTNQIVAERRINQHYANWLEQRDALIAASTIPRVQRVAPPITIQDPQEER